MPEEKYTPAEQSTGEAPVHHEKGNHYSVSPIMSPERGFITVSGLSKPSVEITVNKKTGAVSPAQPSTKKEIGK